MPNRDAPITNAIRRQTRQAYGLMIYRGLITFALLVAGFRAFPDHRTVFALSVISFGLAVSGIAEYLAMLWRVDNEIMDAAERKTRFTILVAAERVSTGHGIEQWDFWQEVNERVEGERLTLDTVETPPRWYTVVGLTAWNVVSRTFGDLVSVGLALIFAGGG